MYAAKLFLGRWKCCATVMHATLMSPFNVPGVRGSTSGHVTHPGAAFKAPRPDDLRYPCRYAFPLHVRSSDEAIVCGLAINRPSDDEPLSRNHVGSMGSGCRPWSLVRRTLYLGVDSSAANDGVFDPNPGPSVPPPSAEGQDDESASALPTRETLRAESAKPRLLSSLATGLRYCMERHRPRYLS
jgi:hypothetical protein